MPIHMSGGVVVSDLGDEPELSAEIAALGEMLRSAPLEQVPSVILNFAGVDYLNSSHIAAVLRLRKRISEGRKQLVLCGLRDQVWSVLLLTGLDKVFVVAPDVAAARAQVHIG